MYIASESASITSEHIIAENRDDLHGKLSLPFTANEDALSGMALLNLMIYNKNGVLRSGYSYEYFFGIGSHSHLLFSEKNTGWYDVFL